MRLIYLLLSPTFGMHQYTADLANRAAAGRFQTSPRVTVVTTTTLPRDRYNPAVEIQAPVTTHCTGFSRAGLDIASYRRVLAGVLEAVSSQSPITGSQPSGGPRAAPVHFTGVHLWNVPLVYALRRRGIDPGRYCNLGRRRAECHGQTAFHGLRPIRHSQDKHRRQDAVGVNLYRY